MKLFDLDWPRVLRSLPRWNALPLPARQILLEELKPSGYVPAERFGPTLDAIVASGIANTSAERTRLFLTPEHRELVKVLRAMHRHPIFDNHGPQSLVKYLEEHFTQAEIERIGVTTAPRSYVHTTRQSLAARVGFSGWPGDFLAAGGDQALADWAATRGHVASPASAARLRVLQQIARHLLASPDGLPLRNLVAAVQDAEIPTLAGALHAGLGTLVLFAGMRGADLEPMIGLWPPAAHELARPPAKRPPVVLPTEEFQLAVKMEDMTTVLAAVLAAPLRLRADDLAVFARARAPIETRLAALPVWGAQLFADRQTNRVDGAARGLEQLGLVKVSQLHGNPHLHGTPNAAAWLALSPHDRLSSLIDPIRSSTQVNPVGSYQHVAGTGFFPFSLPYYRAPDSLNVREALTRVFLGAGDGFIPAQPFAEHAATESNPFLPLLAKGRGADLMMMDYYGSDPRETARILWRDTLLTFLAVRLFALGGARAGRMQDGAFCFALTGVGRYLLGAESTFTYGNDAAADVVIQPNFDVVFLGAAPSTEALLARFAQRAGAAPGLTFKITRASVLAAAEGGATAADVLAAFRQASSKPLPKNVEREIAGWLATVRRARLRVLQVIECADEETADRAVSLLGNKARRLTPTMIELPATNPAARVASVKRLRAGGVFLEDATLPPERRAKPRSRSYRGEWDDEDPVPGELEEMELD